MIPMDIVIRKYMADDSTIQGIVGSKVAISPVPVNMDFPYLEISIVGGVPLTEIDEEVYPLISFSGWGGLLSPDGNETEAAMLNRSNLRSAVVERLRPIMKGRVGIDEFTLGATTYGPYDLSLGVDLEPPIDYEDVDSKGIYFRTAWRIRMSTRS